MNIPQLTALTLLTALLPPATQVDEWGPWHHFYSPGISIQWSQINRDTCTWAFRNDSAHILAAFSFHIEAVNVDTGLPERSSDQLPYALHPGQRWGGWAAFSASASCGSVHITPTDIEWK